MWASTRFSFEQEQYFRNGKSINLSIQRKDPLSFFHLSNDWFKKYILFPVLSTKIVETDFPVSFFFVVAKTLFGTDLNYIS